MKVYANVFLPHFRNYSQEINVVKSKIPDVLIPNVLVHEYMFENVDKWHDKTALVSILYFYLYHAFRLMKKIYSRQQSNGVRARGRFHVYQISSSLHQI